MYAKLNNNKLKYAPKYLVLDNKQILNPAADDYLKAGYKMLEFEQKPEPEENKKVVESYSQDETRIYVSYAVESAAPSRADEIKQELNRLDLISIRPIRAGEGKRIVELESQIQALREELNNINPTY